MYNKLNELFTKIEEEYYEYMWLINTVKREEGVETNEEAERILKEKYNITFDKRGEDKE